jgi:glycosyltransferase involved in cell wall biosynthesis
MPSSRPSSPPDAGPRVALVHDWLNQYGGAERVLEHLVGLFPAAPVYTSIYWPEAMPDFYRHWPIHPMWMDRLPGIHRRQQLYFPLFAPAFDHLNLGEGGYDVVLTNKSGFCHGVRTGSTPHLCYCLSPTRYVWQFEQYAAREALPGPLRVLLRPIVARLRRWDYRVAQRPQTHFVAISREIQARIRTYYHRDSEIIYPPVDIDRFRPAAEHEDYYLIVSRLVPYKRIDLAVAAFTALGLPLVIAGGGRDRHVLEKQAGPTVRFLGHVPDAELPALLARCKAFVFPGHEDFGIAPVEAQAAGRPVIAYRAGGALDTVLEGSTGAFFDEPSPESLAAAVQAFDAAAVDPAACRQNAERFSARRFRADMLSCVHHLL